MKNLTVAFRSFATVPQKAQRCMCSAPWMLLWNTRIKAPIPEAGVGLRLLACCDSGFESRRRHGCLFLVNVVLCQLQISSTGRSLVQGVLPSVVCLSVIEEFHRGGFGPLGLSVVRRRRRTRTRRRTRSIKVCSLNLDTRWRWVINLIFRPLYSLQYWTDYWYTSRRVDTQWGREKLWS
jgi:hypothetical protein